MQNSIDLVEHSASNVPGFKEAKYEHLVSISRSIFGLIKQQSNLLSWEQADL